MVERMSARSEMNQTEDCASESLPAAGAGHESSPAGSPIWQGDVREDLPCRPYDLVADQIDYAIAEATRHLFDAQEVARLLARDVERLFTLLGRL